MGQPIRLQDFKYWSGIGTFGIITWVNSSTTQVFFEQSEEFFELLEEYLCGARVNPNSFAKLSTKCQKYIQNISEMRNTAEYFEATLSFCV